MKKILFAITLAVASTTINAQLVVDSIGRVGIGTETPLSLLSAGGSSHSDAVLSCKMVNKLYDLYASFQGNEENSVCGSNTNLIDTTGTCYYKKMAI